MLTGNDSPLPFALLFSLRGHTRRNRALSAFTIVAIASSVALAVALEMSTRSVQVELERTADAIAGAAQLEVTGGQVGLPEALLDRVASVEGVLAASPLIQWTVRVRGGPLDGQALRILGVDFTSDRKVRGYAISNGTVEVKDPLRLLVQVDSVIVSRKLADELGLREGDTLPVRASEGQFDLAIRGMLMAGGVADAFGGQVAAMDVYSLQELLGRRGWFDRIDVVADEDADLEVLATSLREATAGVASVRRPASRGEYADRVFGTVSLGIWVFVVIGVLVASFLSYATVSQMVDRRTEELALLQSIGLEPSRVRRLVRVDAITLAAAGTLLGTLAGLALAALTFNLFADLSDVVALPGAGQLELGGRTVALALVVGMLVSFLASLEPSYRATSRPPLEVLHASREPAGAAPGLPTLAVMSASALTLALVWFLRELLPPLLGVGVLLVASLVLLVLTVRWTLGPMILAASGTLCAIAPRIGAFVGAALMARPLQTALTSGTIAAVVGGLVGILILLSSTEKSLSEWMAGRYGDGILITLDDPFEAVFSRQLSMDLVGSIRRTQVSGPVLETVSSWIMYRGEQVGLFARSMDVMSVRGRLPALRVESGDLARSLAEGGVAVSEGFARRFGVQVGDEVSLDTPSGPRTFSIKGLLRDYYGPTGTIHIDIEVFDDYWFRRGATAVVVWPSEPERALKAIREAAPDEALFFTRARAYDEWISRTFERFAGLLYLVAGLASILSAVAVYNLMASAVTARRPELALLRAAGATRWHLVGIVFSDGMLVTGLGGSLGLALGLLVSYPMFAIVTDTMGWTIQRTVGWRYLGATVLATLAAGFVSAAYPGWAAQRVRPTEMLEVE